MGKLLLLQGLTDLGVSNYHDIVAKNVYGRPVCKGLFLDFNISHSDGFVICVLHESSVGVDVERVRNVDISMFKDTMTDKQWKDILLSSNPSEVFLKYWTIKESVLKADGRGIIYPMNHLEISNNEVWLDNDVWYVKDLNLLKDFVIHVASKTKEPKFKFKPIAFSQFLCLI